ncbi:MAG: hypothetical protein AB7F28_07020 [Candidatus Margulisiibacteriota bacterium]
MPKIIKDKIDYDKVIRRLNEVGNLSQVCLELDIPLEFFRSRLKRDKLKIVKQYSLTSVEE